jgi:hypothetical protein
MDMNARKDEIDILETTVKLVRFILKNLIWVLLFPALCIAGSYFLNAKQPELYESQLALSGTMVLEEEMALLLRNYSLVGVPGSSNEKNSKLRDFNFKVYTKDNSLFAVITCVATDTSMLRSIYEAIPEQLNQEDIIRAYLEANRSYTTELLREYKQKIQMVEDALQNKKESIMSDVPELLDLHSKAMELESHLKQKSLIKVVSRFKPIKLPVSKPLSLFKGFMIGLLLAVAFLSVKSFVIYYRKTVKETH